jgi:hypothetical protein
MNRISKRIGKWENYIQNKKFEDFLNNINILDQFTQSFKVTQNEIEFDMLANNR